MAVDTIANIKAAFETGDTPTQSDFENLVDTLDASLPVNYRMVAGVLRNTSGSFFQIGGSHKSLNTDDNAITTTSTTVKVDFSALGATDVVTFLVQGDDDHAGLYHTGASVGLTTASFKIYKLVVSGSDVVQQLQDPTTVTSASGNFWYIGIMKVS